MTDQHPTDPMAMFRDRMEQLVTSAGVTVDIERTAAGIRALADRRACAYDIGVCACDKRPGCQAP